MRSLGQERLMLIRISRHKALAYFFHTFSLLVPFQRLLNVDCLTSTSPAAAWPATGAPTDLTLTAHSLGAQHDVSKLLPLP